MNPMKEALKKRKANSINLTIILDQKKPEQEMKPELEIEPIEPDDQENKLEIEPIEEGEMMDEKKMRLMDRAKAAAMGKPRF